MHSQNLDKHLELPKSKKDIYTFLGMTSYYQCYIHDYATKPMPLTELTKKYQPDTGQTGFPETLKAALRSMAKRNPDPKQTFVIQTDASAVPYLAKGRPIDPLPISAGSCWTKKEGTQPWKRSVWLLSYIGAKAFAVHLLGKQFILQMDHRALKWYVRPVLYHDSGHPQKYFGFKQKT